MNTKAKKARSPFTPTYSVSISTHEEFPEDERPIYIFRAATIKERHAEQVIADRIDNIANEDEDLVCVDDLVEEVIPILTKRLVRVEIDNKPDPAELDIEESLDISSVLELFTSAVLLEIPSIAEKKRSLLQSRFDTVASALDAEVATESQTLETESPNSSAQDALATDAETATKTDGLN